MKLSTKPTRQCSTEEHIAEFLAMLGVEGVEPTMVRLRYKAGALLPVLSLEGSDVNASYYLYAPGIEDVLSELFDLPKCGMISSLEFEWRSGNIGTLKLEHYVSVIETDFVTGIKATKIGD